MEIELNKDILGNSPRDLLTAVLNSHQEKDKHKVRIAYDIYLKISDKKVKKLDLSGPDAKLLVEMVLNSPSLNVIGKGSLLTLLEE